MIGTKYTFGQTRKAFVNVVGLILSAAVYVLHSTVVLPSWITTTLLSVVGVATVIVHFDVKNDAALTAGVNMLDSTPLTAGAAAALIEKLVPLHLDKLLAGAPSVLAVQTATPVSAPVSPATGVRPSVNLQDAMDAALTGNHGETVPAVPTVVQPPA